MRALAPLLRSAANNAPTRPRHMLDPSFAAAAAKSLFSSAAAAAEPADEFERRIFGNVSEGGSTGFFRRLEKVQLARHQRPPAPAAAASEEGAADGGSYSTLQDGMDQKLMNAAASFKLDFVDTSTANANRQDPGGFRPNPSFYPGPYDSKQQRPYRPRFLPRYEFKVTTEEVLQKADFRNVRFLANFITEAGIIVKRSKTGISAKAQRKIAREIKTARAFGLMPFTTMGTKSFVFGQTMKEADAPKAKVPGHQ